MLSSRLSRYLAAAPSIESSAYIAPGAFIVGDVHLAKCTSVWPTAVLRGDINYIAVGEGSNIQDGAIVHLADDFPSIIGAYVTIGHRAVIHACTIEDECLIGMGSIILDGARIGKQSIIAAGAVIAPHTIIPEGSMVMGVPGKVTRLLSKEERLSIRSWAQKYVELSQYYKANRPAFNH